MHLLSQVPTVRFHDLRDGASSLMFTRGVALRTLMEVLELSSLALTATYTHLVVALHEDSIPEEVIAAAASS